MSPTRRSSPETGKADQHRRAKIASERDPQKWEAFLRIMLDIDLARDLSGQAIPLGRITR
jgi:hypothetical protein